MDNADRSNDNKDSLPKTTESKGRLEGRLSIADMNFTVVSSGCVTDANINLQCMMHIVLRLSQSSRETFCFTMQRQSLAN